MVQSNHATHTMASRAAAYSVDGIPNLIMIGVPDLRALNRVAAKLADNAIPHCAWTESDFDLGFTAIATVPLTADQKKPLANYRLWKPVHHHSPVAQLDRADRGFGCGKMEVRILSGEPVLEMHP